MKSTISSAVLGAAALAQLAFSASIHGHGHMHKRAPTPAVQQRDVAAVQFISTADIAALTNKGIKTGKNAACTEQGDNSVAVGDDGPFVVEFNNQSEEDVIVVVWTGEGQWGAVSASFIGATQPDVTHTLQANTSTWVSFDPSKVSGNAISGGFGAIYESTGLTSFSGQLSNTWGELTFNSTSAFSTVDVSRLVNMGGSDMEIHTYTSQSEAQDDGVSPTCSSTMSACAFVCADGAEHCMVGSIVGCPVGEAGNTSDGVDNGGCGGLPAEGGYVVVNFK